MAKKKVKQEIEKKDNNDTKLFAFLATFLSIIGFVIALVAKRDDKYVMYYAKQSLVIFVIGVIAGMIGSFFKAIPIIGTIINMALWIIIFIIWVISWINSLTGKEKRISIVSDFADKINL